MKQKMTDCNEHVFFTASTIVDGCEVAAENKESVVSSKPEFYYG